MVQLTTTFYRKLSKRYLSPSQGVNANLIKEKINKEEKEGILRNITE